MSKSTSTDIPKYSSAGKLSPDDPILESCGISSKMRRFVHRMRLRAKDLDLADPARAAEFDRCSETMRGILGKRKISTKVANKIVAQTLDAAADHLLDYMRQDRLVQDLERSKKDRERLINHFRCLALSISKLPPTLRISSRAQCRPLTRYLSGFRRSSIKPAPSKRPSIITRDSMSA
jgi:hypothetical protein